MASTRPASAQCLSEATAGHTLAADCHALPQSSVSETKLISNASNPTASTPNNPRPVTSDMISFKATVVLNTNEDWAPRPSNVAPPVRRKRRFLWLCQKEPIVDETKRRSHPFGEMKIESTIERRSSDFSRNGYMYSRGSLANDALVTDIREVRPSALSRGSSLRAWSQALSVTHEGDEDVTAITALVNTTPMTVWSAFLQTANRYPNEVAVRGWEHIIAPVDGTYTWAQQAIRVQRIARAFVHTGFCAGEGVVISASMSPLLQAVNLAAIALGGIVAHVRNSWSTRELCDAILPTANATILILDAIYDNFYQALATLANQPVSFQIRAVIVLGEITNSDRVVADLGTHIPVFSAHSFLSIPSLESHASAWTSPIETLMSRVSPDQCCVLAFDYDARGRIRAAALSQDNVVFTAGALMRSFGLSHRDRLVGYLPLYHVAAQVLEFYLPLLAGLSVVCAPTYAHPLVRVISDFKPTVFFAAPSTWAQFSQQVYHAKRDVNAVIYRWAKARATNNSQKLLFARGEGVKHRSLGYMLAQALVLNNIKKKFGLENCTACYSLLAPLDFELERLFKTVDTPIYQLFGTPETCGFAAVNFPHAWEFGSSGRALPGTTIRCDERSQETVLRGRNVFLGYRKAASTSLSTELLGDDSKELSTMMDDSDGWLRMRQRAFLTPTGFLRLNDPRDFLVLSTGDWIPIQPFECAMMKLMPELVRAVLIGDGRTFLSALFFLKTSVGGSRMIAGNSKHVNGRHLDDEALKVGHSIKSAAMTVGEAIRCQQWAVHFDVVLEKLPDVCCISGHRVRKWILMAADFSVESGELDPDTGDVCRRGVAHKYHALLESLYN
ncbi:hypothetical protein CCR75_008331 [Bremia lactucae]|uniref:AMP-dependent synthetase/ligase domain-containing protein n=1 Tax=Bremia lactucae TaxID=4779 RepID=A0A976FPN6_BRELC|nr:hypothetical protein CCR75_008331 [Bremia lactucae]